MKTIADVYAEHNAADSNNSQAPTSDQACRCVNCKAHQAGETGPAKAA